ncbi:PH domain-containing protein [Hyalangium rubrum]|uniref:PH domain-containing protein n=1 Tax=Hyalangium rubrum TaxID=3103134 RepID=A0ABU5GZW3_9BACT|nr:PH domain-containing protein [Hyalangium sp. s54d21]MDY7226077.1 PH domain-containing protein [Hyalangium sp. s54d21]
MSSEATPPSSDTPRPSAPTEFPWQRLHPASALANLLPVTLRLLRGMAVPLVTLALVSRKDGELARLLVPASVFFILSLAFTVLHALSTRYRLAGGRLEIVSGFVFRRTRTIDVTHVQNTEVVQPFTHRLLGLVQVKIETASGLKSEGELSALSPEKAQELISALQTARGAAAPTAEAAPVTEELIVQNSPRDLVRYGATATGLGVGAVLVGLALDEVEASRVVFRVLERRWEAWAGSGVLWVGVVVGVLVALTLLLVGNGVVAAVRYHGFRLAKAGERFQASFGLLTRRQVGLNLHRIQLVTVDEPLPRRWLRFGSVEVETAGLRTGEANVEQAEVVVPVVAAERMSTVVRELVPELPGELSELTLNPPHPRALWRARVRAVVSGSLVALLLTGLLWPWGALAWGLLPLELWRAWLDHRHQGWLLTEHLVIVRTGFWRRRTSVLRRGRIQSVSAVQGPLERRHGLGHAQVAVAGANVSLPSVAWEEALRLLDVLSPRRPRPSTPPVPVAPSDDVPQTTL